MNTKDTCFRELDEINNKYGIELIQEYIKQKTKKTPKKQGRPSKSIHDGAEVYFYMYGLNFIDYENFYNATQQMKITDAKELLSEKKGKQFKSVDKNVTDFNAFSKKLQYEKFCKYFQNHFERFAGNTYGYESDLDFIRSFAVQYANGINIQKRR